jgi:hypothetical protein
MLEILVVAVAAACGVAVIRLGLAVYDRAPWTAGTADEPVGAVTVVVIHPPDAGQLLAAPRPRPALAAPEVLAGEVVEDVALTVPVRARVGAGS